MTEQTNAELIAEANRALAENQWTSGWGVESLAERLADALESADKRAAEYAAVVEKAEDFVTRHYLDTRFGDEVLPILTSAGADALREHDAKVRAEALREAYADLQSYTDSGAPFGHRPVEEFLLHRADRIEREAGLK